MNDSKTTIKQEFYDASGKKLSKCQLDVPIKATIKTVESNRFTRNLREVVDKNFIVKDGTTFDFGPGYVHQKKKYTNDPRDRRVSVKIPNGLKLVDPDHKWTYDKESDTYYKDMGRNHVKDENLTATVDLGGLDLSDYPGGRDIKDVTINYSLSVVKDGIVQNDIPPEKWTSTGRFYAPKEVPPAYGVLDTYRSETLIDSNYKALGKTVGSNYKDLDVFLPFDESLLTNYRMKFFHQAIRDFSFYNSNEENDPKLSIINTETEVTGYTYPSELRLNLQTEHLTDEEIQNFAAKLEGTKAYGVKYDDHKVLLTDRVPIAYNGKGEYFKFKGSKYKSIRFEYPNGGLIFNNKAEIDKYKHILATDVIADFRPESVQMLKNKLKGNQKPKLDYRENAKGLEEYNDYSTVRYKLNFKRLPTDTERTGVIRRLYADTNTSKYLAFNEIKRGSPIKLYDASTVFPGKKFTIQAYYYQVRHGDSLSAVKPENANIYYLVPDGLEPVENPEVFSQISVIRGYREGYNLVIAKPKVTDIPMETGTLSITNNFYNLEVTANNRLEAGEYKIYAALVIDNNKVGNNNQKPYGIMQYDTPNGLWEGITTSIDNRSEIENRFTDFKSCSFTVYPPYDFAAFKEVKLHAEPDSSYASALGMRGHIGDEIDYRWLFKNNSKKEIKNLTVIDVLPYKGDHAIVPNLAGEYPSRGSKFHTPLKSVEANEKFDFYYSTDDVKGTLEENKNASWHESVEDPSQVTMIKAVLKPKQKIGLKETCSIVTHNQIENNASIKDGEKAYNSFAYSYNDGVDFTEALKTEVSVNYPKKDVLVKKVDRKDESKPIANVSFDLYSSDGKLLKEGLLTNQKGELLLRNLLVGESYYLLEKSAPDPYVVNDQKISFIVSDQQDQQVLLVKNGTDKIDIPVIKLWEDQDNKEAKRPESIKVKLLADGIETGKELILNEANQWTGSFTDLAKYNSSGEETNYSVKEVGEVDHSAHIDGIWYKVEVAGNMVDGFTITNKKQNPVTPPVPKKRNIEVEKKWKDSKGKPMSAPVKSIQVELYENGKATGKKKILKASNSWKASFKDLPTAKKSNGALIDYTVKEVGANNNQMELSGDSYKVSMTGNLKEGFTITNQLQDIPNKPKNPTPPTPPEKPNLPGKPDFPHRTRIPEKKIKEYRANHKLVPKVIDQTQERNPNTGAASFSLVPLVGFASLLFITRKKRNK